MITLQDMTYSYLRDNNRIYMIHWEHFTQNFRLFEIDNPLAGNLIETNLLFVDGMEVVVNAGKDYYENVYCLKRDNTGNINAQLTAIGLFNHSLLDKND